MITAVIVTASLALPAGVLVGLAFGLWIADMRKLPRNPRGFWIGPRGVYRPADRLLISPSMTERRRHPEVSHI